MDAACIEIVQRGLRGVHPACMSICAGRPEWSYRSMFIFFSNRLGCLGSILVSAVLTLVLLLLFGVI